MAVDISYLTPFLSFTNWTPSLRRLCSSYQCRNPMWCCIVHLFRLAKDAYDANPSILKCKIKGGSAHSCKTVLTVSLEVVLLKEWKSCMPFKYLERWNEIIASSESLLGTQLILTLNSILKWWKAGHDEGCLLTDSPQTWKIQTMIRHKQQEL